MTVVVHSRTINRVFGTDSAIGDYPVNIQAGDLLVMAVGSSDELAEHAVPLGWTRRINRIGTAAGSRVSFTLLSRVADGSESGTVTVAVSGLSTGQHHEVAIFRTSGGTLGNLDDVTDTGFSTTKAIPAVNVVGAGAAMLVGTYSTRNEVTTYSDPAMTAATRDRFLSVTSGPAPIGSYTGRTSAQANPANALTFAVVIENANPADAKVVEFAAFEWQIESSNTAIPQGISVTPEIGALALVVGRTVALTEIIQPMEIGSLSIVADVDGPAMFRLPGEWQTHQVEAAWEDKIEVPGAWRIV